MAIRDKFIIILMLVLIVIFGLALRTDAGIIIGGTTINCEYDLAKYASDNPNGFVTSNIDISWLTKGAFNLHNVNCSCNLSSRATIGWTTAYCINHNGGALIESYGSNPHIVDIIDIKWNTDKKQYQAWIHCETGGEIAIAPKVYTEDFIGKLARGVYLAANEGRIYWCI